MIDGFGRRIEYLRVSVTDKCNLRCVYCMPMEGLEWLRREDLLTYEEITRIVRVMAPMGLRRVRFTGGEPLVRRDLPDLVAAVAAVPGIEDLSLSTNAVLLEENAEALRRAGHRPGERVAGHPPAGADGRHRPAQRLLGAHHGGAGRRRAGGLRPHQDQRRAHAGAERRRDRGLRRDHPGAALARPLHRAHAHRLQPRAVGRRLRVVPGGAAAGAGHRRPGARPGARGERARHVPPLPGRARHRGRHHAHEPQLLRPVQPDAAHRRRTAPAVPLRSTSRPTCATRSAGASRSSPWWRRRCG